MSTDQQHPSAADRSESSPAGSAAVTKSAEAAASIAGATGLRRKWLEFHHHYELQLTIFFFICGFTFDLFMATRVDDWHTLAQQAVYLLLIAVFLFFEVKARERELKVPWGLKTLWDSRELIEHFFFGTLLNFYSIFYFKSASIFSSFAFLIFLCVVIAANEMPMFRKFGPSLRVTLLSLCLSSFFSILFPIWFGFAGAIPFVLACASTGVILLYMHSLLKKQVHDQARLSRQFLRPGLSLLAVFVLLYVARVTPPVPISAPFAGVFHNVEKKGGEYVLWYDKSSWWSWLQPGEHSFQARPGDKLYFFANIFSPSHFSQELNLRWLHYDSRRGWTVEDVIPININGGREQGYRGYAFKSNYAPGDWRIQLETPDGHEVTRVYVSVVLDTEQGPRPPLTSLVR